MTRRQINKAGLAIVKDSEGLVLKAYSDPGSGGEPWTIGRGTTIYPDGRKVRAGDVITEAQADEYLRHDLAKFEAWIAANCSPATDNQFSALVSFAYNVGTGALKDSTLRRKHLEGDYAGAAGEFGRWNKASGKILAGLTKRRAREAQLYRSVS